jgi:hypothetical protein
MLPDMKKMQMVFLMQNIENGVPTIVATNLNITQSNLCS